MRSSTNVSTIIRFVRFWETKIGAALNAGSVWAQMSRFSTTFFGDTSKMEHF